MATRLATTITTAAALFLTGVGVSYAWVQAAGGGTNPMFGATGQDVVLVGTTMQQLVPGDDPIPLLIRFTNHNGFAVRATAGITVHVDTSPAAAWPAACHVADFTIVDVAGPIDFAAHLTSPTDLPTHVGGTIRWLSNGDQTGCLKALDALGGVPLTFTLVNV